MKPVCKTALIAAAAACLWGEGFAQDLGRQVAPEAGAVPEIRPGEHRVMSLEQLTPGGRKFFMPDREMFLPKPRLLKGGISVRVIESTAAEVSLIDGMLGRPGAAGEKSAVDAPFTSLENTQLAEARHLAILREAPVSGGPVSRVTRVFALQDRRVALTEWDYLANGGGIVQFSEFVNTSVNSTPAVLYVKRTPERALWQLTWSSAGLSYTLLVEEPGLDDDTAELALSIARSLRGP